MVGGLADFLMPGTRRRLPRILITLSCGAGIKRLSFTILSRIQSREGCRMECRKVKQAIRDANNFSHYNYATMDWEKVEQEIKGYISLERTRTKEVMFCTAT